MKAIVVVQVGESLYNYRPILEPWDNTALLTRISTPLSLKETIPLIVYK